MEGFVATYLCTRYDTIGNTEYAPQKYNLVSLTNPSRIITLWS